MNDYYCRLYAPEGSSNPPLVQRKDLHHIDFAPAAAAKPLPARTCVRIRNTIFKREDVQRVWVDTYLGKFLRVFAYNKGNAPHYREEVVFEFDTAALAHAELDRIWKEEM